MKQVLSVLVNNSSGVLSHVTGLFTRRGYNIDSLSVGVTHAKDKSVITIVADEDEKHILQVTKQLYKVVDVISVENLTYKDSLKRELLLATISVNKKNRAEILNLVDAFQGSIVDVTDKQIMVEMVGIPRRVAAFISAMSDFGIENMARTGTIALPFPSYNDEPI